MVIAIIGILIALLLPAVQAARAQARSAQCQSQLKQWALAMNTYANANRRLPIGSRDAPRQTWVMFLWPYMDERALFTKFDKTLGFWESPNEVPDSMAGLCGQFVSLYYCPSDTEGKDQTTGNPNHHCRRRGNYVVNWGNVTYGTDDPNKIGPFSHISGAGTNPRPTKFANIVDGTSHTLLMSEVLRAFATDDVDWRGDIHNDQGEFRFHTLLTPNSTSPDIIGKAQDTMDPLMPFLVQSGSSQVTAARSRHRGGVNVSFCDGSVHFMTDFISANTWKALGSINGKDLVGNY